MAPKSQWLAERVAKEMRERHLVPARAGGRMAPVRQLARELGVCVRTVLAAQRILAKTHELDIRHGSGVYVPASRGPLCVGLFSAFNVLQPRASSFHTLALHYLRRFFNRQPGLEAEVYIGQDEAGEWQQAPANRRFLADIESGRLAGVVITSAPPTHGWTQWVARLPIPAVGAYTPYRLDTAYDRFVLEAVQRLYEQGCRRIAMLAWAHDGLRQPLRKALAACGLTYRPEWVRHDLEPSLSGAGWEQFREIWSARREKPDGLLAADDVLFAEASVAIQELGIAVPDRLKIVTHANKGAGRRYPFPVTEGLVDPERYAEAMGTMLLKRLRGEPVEPPMAVLPIELVETRPAGAVAARSVAREMAVVGDR